MDDKETDNVENGRRGIVWSRGSKIRKLSSALLISSFHSIVDVRVDAYDRAAAGESSHWFSF